MKFSLFVIAILLSVSAVNAQEKDLTKPPAGSAAFISKGYELLDYETGDLNGDGRKDVVLVLKRAGEDTLDMDDPNNARPLLLLTRQSNNKLTLAARNDELIMCRQCGGIFGDPYEGITVGKNMLTINFYGGSAWRWGMEYQFRYNATTKNWMLEKETDIYYHNAEPDKMKTTVYKKEELGAVAITGMPGQLGPCSPKYRVIAAKTYFYDQPDLKSKPRKGYLLKGDVVSCNRQTTNFISAYFTNNNDKSTEGFILKKDLVAVPE